MDLNHLSTTQLIVSGCACLIVGYLIFLGMLAMLPSRLRSESQQQLKEMKQKHLRNRQKTLRDSLRRHEQKATLQRESMEAELDEKQSDLQEVESELNILSDTISQTEARIIKRTSDYKNRLTRANKLKAEYEKRLADIDNSKAELQKALEMKNDLESGPHLHRIKQAILDERNLAAQKSLRDYFDDLNTHSGKMATRMLSRVLSRYAPTFAWPKTSYVVDIKNQELADYLNSDKCNLLAQLRELTEDVQIAFTTDKEDTPSLGIKLVGGYGIYKEAGRLTLEELLNQSKSHWGRIEQVYQKHCRVLEKQALRLGQRAAIKLQLEGLHSEILKMVGALNWRTSYRQNQYLHSVEVSELAGILANEIGVNPQEAKRCGLLHDIGKGIDYRIEGSHAVISGDYADRFGESRLICDTVMSHHNDLVLESPLSYVLKTADTLSGARPGARVNLEEGYQIRLSSIDQAVRSFKGVSKVAIMSGGREVHVEVNHNKVSEEQLSSLAEAIAKKIEEEVAFPGQIKVLIARKFEASAVA